MTRKTSAAPAGDICGLSLVELIAALQSNRISPGEARQACQQRQRELKHLNAFTQHINEIPDDKLETVCRIGQSGALAGIPLAAKDNIDVIGFKTTAGTPALSEFAPKRDAPVVQILKAAGAMVLGKTNMHELSFGATSINPFTGPVRNPVNPELIAGGSSGGSAAAVAAGLAPAALGTDTGGSCRIPAALCGVVGYRPSNGRYSNEGVVPLSFTRDTIGILAKTVEDVILLDGVIKGANSSATPAPLRGLRFGVPDEATLADCASEVADGFELILTALAKFGGSFSRVDLARLHSLNQRTTRPLIAYEAPRDLSMYLLSHGARITARDVFERASGEVERERLLSTLASGQIDNATYQHVMSESLPALRAAYLAEFDDGKLDAILQPTTMLAAQPISSGEVAHINGREAPAFAAYTRLADAPSNAGLACMSLPVRKRPSPLGVELQCENGEDHRLFSIALSIEQLLREQLGSLPTKLSV